MASSCLRVRWALNAEKPADGNCSSSMRPCITAVEVRVSLAGSGVETPGISFPARRHPFWRAT